MLPMSNNAFMGEEHLPFFWDGEKGVVLLIHGYPGTPSEMRPFAQCLNKEGWATKAILLPGFGNEIATLNERSNEEWVQAIYEEIKALQAHFDHVFVLGYSLGGALVVQAVATCTEKPTGVILLAPFWKLDHWLWKALPLLKHLFPHPKIYRYLGLDFNAPGVRRSLRNLMPDANLDDPRVQKALRNYPLPMNLFVQIYKAGRQAHQCAKQLEIPTLVIQGQYDDLVKPHLTDKFVENIPTVRYCQVQTKHDLFNTNYVAWNAIQENITTFVGIDY